MDFGKLIRFYREKIGFTQSELAQKIFINEKTLSHYETGKRTPSPQLLSSLAKELGVKINVFFGEENVEEKIQYQMLQFPMELIDFKKWLKDENKSYPYSIYDSEMERQIFELLIGSDKFFLQLNHPLTKETKFGYGCYYIGGYLIWLLDGFAYIPEYRNDLNSERLLLDEIRELKQSDLAFLERTINKNIPTGSTEETIANIIWHSKYEYQTMTISTDKDSLYEDTHRAREGWHVDHLITKTDGRFSYDEELHTFFLKTNEGILLIPSDMWRYKDEPRDWKLGFPFHEDYKSSFEGFEEDDGKLSAFSETHTPMSYEETRFLTDSEIEFLRKKVNKDIERLHEEYKQILEENYPSGCNFSDFISSFRERDGFAQKLKKIIEEYKKVPN